MWVVPKLAVSRSSGVYILSDVSADMRAAKDTNDRERHAKGLVQRPVAWRYKRAMALGVSSCFNAGEHYRSYNSKGLRFFNPEF